MEITPDKKDLDRAAMFCEKTNAQINAQFKSIKNVDKLLRRGVAWVITSPWADDEIVRTHAYTLGVSEEKLKIFNETVKKIKQERRDKFAEEMRDEELRVKS